uniref:Uncharacterized protein n=1 Tax=Junco hyemalis TaxID=40217 RepID=A0A8C5JNL9_JUNHY
PSSAALPAARPGRGGHTDGNPTLNHTDKWVLERREHSCWFMSETSGSPRQTLAHSAQTWRRLCVAVPAQPPGTGALGFRSCPSMRLCISEYKQPLEQKLKIKLLGRKQVKHLDKTSWDRYFLSMSCHPYQSCSASEVL